ncbi:MAG: GNAT family N-acetyltransferase [Flavobacterium sp.]|nr:MAG: GNAT family N-acetyltransferase [Flavobacterium sp.]
MKNSLNLILCQVSFKPSEIDLTKIKIWLEKEDLKERFSGFLCNWNSIFHSYTNNEIAVIVYDSEPVGFMTWQAGDKDAKIQIAEIKPGFRKKGLGKILAENVFDYLRKLNVAVVYLHCQPPESESAWKKMGFLEFPAFADMEHYNNKEEGRHLYIPLLDCAENNQIEKSTETLSLWPVESYMANKVPAQWNWNLEYIPGTRILVKPIIFPAKYKWNLSWEIDGLIIKNRQIKSFGRSEIHFNCFLILSELPLAIETSV